MPRHANWVAQNRTFKHFCTSISKSLKISPKTVFLLFNKTFPSIKWSTCNNNRLVFLRITLDPRRNQEKDRGSIHRLDLNGVKNISIESSISFVWTINKYIAGFVLSLCNRTCQTVLQSIYIRSKILTDFYWSMVLRNIRI